MKYFGKRITKLKNEKIENSISFSDPLEFIKELDYSNKQIIPKRNNTFKDLENTLIEVNNINQTDPSSSLNHLDPNIKASETHSALFVERSQSNSPKKSIEINTRKISTHENIKKINQSPRQSRIFNSDLKNIIIESMTASVRGSSQKKEVFGREKSATIEKKRNSLQNINPINNSSKPRLSGFLQNIKNSNIKINPKKNSENSIRKEKEENSIKIMEVEKEKEIDSIILNPKKTLLEKNLLKNKEQFSPKSNGIQPKYFHNLFLKKIFNDPIVTKSTSRIKTERSIQIKKHQIDISDNNSYYLQRKISIKKVPNNNSFSKTSKSNENSSFQVLNKILESEGKKKELKLEKQNKKQKITMLTDFYLDFLRKIELIKFSKSKEKGNQYIEIENLKILEENDLGIYNFINSNFGRDYFVMLKRIFNIYSEKKIGFSNSILTFRNFLKFSKEFNILKSESHNLQLIYSKSIGNKQCDFNKFIELLLVLSSINSLKIEKESKIERFKFFIDNFLIMPYKVKFSEKSDIERIQVFYNHYDQFENPTLGLMISCDDLFQHIFSMYQHYDIKISNQSFIDSKNFLKMCSDFKIIPNFCTTNQIMKIFNVYQNNKKDVIEFKGFLTVLCCIAHIVYCTNDDYKGFYKKMWKFCDNIKKVNNQISEKIINTKNLYSK